MKIKALLKNKSNIIIIIVAILSMILISTFIRTSDDYFWGSLKTYERIMEVLQQENGRYLGNAIILAISKNHFLRIIVIFSTLFGIVYLTNKIANTKRTIGIQSGIIITIFLMVSVPKQMFIEVYAWASGFTNYGIASLGILYIIYLHLEKKNISKNKNLNFILFFLLGIFNSLFMEHATIYNLILAFYLIIYNYINNKQVNIKDLVYFAGASFGTVLMFSHNAYTRLDGSGKVAINTFKSATKQYFENFNEGLFMSNIIINVSVLLLLYLILFKIDKQEKNNKITKTSFGYATVYTIYSIVKFLIPELFQNTNILEGIISPIYALSILTITLNLKINKDKKYKLVFVLCSIIVIAAPLLVASPIPSRCFFITYIGFVLYIILLIEHINFKKFYTFFTTVVLLTYLIFYLYIYSTIYLENKVRIEYILEQIDNDSKNIYIYKLKYNEYVFDENYHAYETMPLFSYDHARRWALYFQLPGDAKIIYIDKPKKISNQQKRIDKGQSF